MKIKENKRHFLHCNIAGFSYHEGCTIYDQLKIGSPIRIVREDENKYDPNAVALFFGDTMLGYVPRQENQQLALLLDMGYEDIFEAHIQSLNANADPENQVNIIIYVQQNKK